MKLKYVFTIFPTIFPNLTISHIHRPQPVTDDHTYELTSTKKAGKLTWQLIMSEQVKKLQ
jgi:hypothetical protein